MSEIPLIELVQAEVYEAQFRLKYLERVLEELYRIEDLEK